MGSSNTAVSVTNLDFVDIKTNLTQFLQSQTVFKDYNFAGSGLSVLLDILAFNTQYNAYYLNMVANEMFLDSALQRSSVVSHAKLLGYIPKSAIAPTAVINVIVNQVSERSLTLPKFTQLISRAINGVNYTFVTDDSITVDTVSNTATFNNVILKEGIPRNYSFVVDSSTNPKYMFEIPDENVDTSSLQVIVQQSNVNTSVEVFDKASNVLELNDNSIVYFIQEGMSGKYQVYFGDGILGKKLTDGNIVLLSYISTNGINAHDANNFTLLQPISGYSNTSIIPVMAATNGSEKELIESVKFQAPKSFSAQNRAVSKNDYITLIQQNTLGISFDAVNVWGGEEELNPVYGNIFISLKPKGSYLLTNLQKSQLLKTVISPVSVLTVKPSIIDPDYTYLKLVMSVYYNPSKTLKTSNEILTGVRTSIYDFASSTLNTFNSTFSPVKLLNAVQNYDSSIISSDYDLSIQKKILPVSSVPTTYVLNYNTPLQKGQFLTGVTSSPSMQFVDPLNPSNIIDGVYMEEVPINSNGVDSITILNPGNNYQVIPTVTIFGDGVGATATATIYNGSITSITITNAGSGYTAAIATVTPQVQDTTGKLAALVVNLQGNIGTLRTYYNNTLDVKTILNSNIGTIDYVNGVITLNAFNPHNVNNPLGQLAITANPTSSLISSTFNGIITVDPYDPAAIEVNIIAQS